MAANNHLHRPALALMADRADFEIYRTRVNKNFEVVP